MRPDVALALSFFAIQWVLNAKINYASLPSTPLKSTTLAPCHEP